MQNVALDDRKVMYLGSIDDKVVEYAGIVNPERQLLHTLFFSVILGDPLVLNDGYLLHSAWGRGQLTDENSALRKLNRSGHLLLAARDSRRYTDWIPEQAEKTGSYRQLWDGLKRREKMQLDQAWSDLRCVPWPSIDVQHIMRNLLRANGEVLLDEGIAREKLEEHRQRWEQRMAKQTVRGAWEAAMLDMGNLLSTEDRVKLMGLANEAYHASQACGYSGGGGGQQVGVASYGRRRLQSRGAYRTSMGTDLRELLSSYEWHAAMTRLGDLATIQVISREQGLFEGTMLETLVANAAAAKDTYRKSLRNLFSGENSIAERVQMVESAVEEYADYIRRALQPKRSTAVMKLMDLTAAAAGKMEDWSEYLEFTCSVIDHKLSTPLDTTRKYLTAGLPIIPHLYEVAQSRRVQQIDLLADQSGDGYELDLDVEFVSSATEGVPAFAPIR